MLILFHSTKNRRAGQVPGKPEIQLPPHGGEITISIEVTSESQRQEQARERERERKSTRKSRTGLSQTQSLGSFLSQSTQPSGNTQLDVKKLGGEQSWAARVREDLERRSKLAAHASSRAGADESLGATGGATSVSGAASGSGLGGDVGGVRPSDEVEYARFVVRWEPVADWLGVSVPRYPGDEDDLQVVRWELAPRGLPLILTNYRTPRP